jgi:hypothetical protein
MSETTRLREKPYMTYMPLLTLIEGFLVTWLQNIPAENSLERVLVGCSMLVVFIAVFLRTEQVTAKKEGADVRILAVASPKQSAWHVVLWGVVWVMLWVAGVTTGTASHFEIVRAYQTEALPQIAVSVLIILTCWTYTNSAFLCVIATILGGLLTPARTSSSAALTMGGWALYRKFLKRGIGVYLLAISGVVFLGGPLIF